MTEGTTVREGWFRFLRRHKWLVVIPAVVSTVATVAVSSRMPRRYQSEASLLLIPQRVPADYVRPATQTTTDDRVRSISQQILSRTRLERIIEEYKLYSDARQRLIMEEIIQRMRDDIEIRTTSHASGAEFNGVTIGYTSDDPRTAMRVTDRLAQLVVEENIRERERTSEGTNQFLGSQVEETRRRILELEKALAGAPAGSRIKVVEYEALQQHYKNLLLKSEEARLAANLERRQIGEQLKPLDSARLPEKPVGPSRRVVNLIGALSGLAVGFLLVGAQSVRERRKSNPEAHVA